MYIHFSTFNFNYFSTDKLHHDAWSLCCIDTIVFSPLPASRSGKVAVFLWLVTIARVAKGIIDSVSILIIHLVNPPIACIHMFEKQKKNHQQPQKNWYF